MMNSMNRPLHVDIVSLRIYSCDPANSRMKPEVYGDLVYKFKKIRGMTDFSDQFRKIIMRYTRIGYNLNVMRQSACLAINPITVDGYATLFNCMLVDRVSDSMMAPTSSYSF